MDVAQGIFQLERAADMGNADAEMLLGETYLQGMLVKRDPAVARRWFEHAAARVGRSQILRPHARGGRASNPAHHPAGREQVGSPGESKPVKALIEDGNGHPRRG